MGRDAGGGAGRDVGRDTGRNTGGLREKQEVGRRRSSRKGWPRQEGGCR